MIYYSRYAANGINNASNASNQRHTNMNTDNATNKLIAHVATLDEAQQQQFNLIRMELASRALTGLLANSSLNSDNCTYAEEAVRNADRLIYALAMNPVGSLS
jgi:hypothetical protein